MVTPTLAQGMEQGGHLSSQRIYASLLRAFVDIARETSQAEIVGRRWPIGCLRNDVVNVHL